MILFRCNCDEEKIFSAIDDYAGKLGECPACGKIIRLPASSPDLKGRLKAAPIPEPERPSVAAVASAAAIAAPVVAKLGQGAAEPDPIEEPILAEPEHVAETEAQLTTIEESDETLESVASSTAGASRTLSDHDPELVEDLEEPEEIALQSDEEPDVVEAELQVQEVGSEDEESEEGSNEESEDATESDEEVEEVEVLESDIEEPEVEEVEEVEVEIVEDQAEAPVEEVEEVLEEEVHEEPRAAPDKAPFRGGKAASAAKLTPEERAKKRAERLAGRSERPSAEAKTGARGARGRRTASTEEKPKSNLVMIIVIVIAVLLIGGTAFYVMNKKDHPTKTKKVPAASESEEIEREPSEVESDEPATPADDAAQPKVNMPEASTPIDPDASVQTPAQPEQPAVPEKPDSEKTPEELLDSISE